MAIIEEKVWLHYTRSHLSLLFSHHLSIFTYRLQSYKSPLHTLLLLHIVINFRVSQLSLPPLSIPKAGRILRFVSFQNPTRL